LAHSSQGVQKERICRDCWRQLYQKESKGHCPLCNQLKQLTSIDPKDPDKLRHICKKCYKAANMGICPQCKQEKQLISKNPNNQQERISPACRRLMDVKTRMGECPDCKREKPLMRIDPRDKNKTTYICEGCYVRIKRRKKAG